MYSTPAKALPSCTRSTTPEACLPLCHEILCHDVLFHQAQTRSVPARVPDQKKGQILQGRSPVLGCLTILSIMALLICQPVCLVQADTQEAAAGTEQGQQKTKAANGPGTEKKETSVQHGSAEPPAGQASNPQSSGTESGKVVRKDPSVPSAQPVPGDGQKEEASPYSEGAMKLWPSVDSLVTSAFGERRSSGIPLTGRAPMRSRRHSGLDIRGHLGWPVRTLRSGVVLSAGPSGAAGLTVKILQDNKKTVSYAHLGEILVTRGQKVTRGQHIGKVGCTGRTTGAHLHLTVRDSQGRHINPRKELTGLWELYDPPLADLSGPIRAQACSGKFGQAGRPVNRRLYGSQQYLRMRKALIGIEDYKIPDISTWESMHK